MDDLKVYEKYLKICENIGTIGKDGVNKFFQNAKYTKLSTILQAVNPVIHQNKCVFTIEFKESDIQNKHSETRLEHIDTKKEKNGEIITISEDRSKHWFRCVATLLDVESGHKMEFEYTIPLSSTNLNDIQAYGSTTTYAQRYIYGMVFNIPFDDEDPDNHSQAPKTYNKQSSNSASNYVQKPRKLSEKQKTWIINVAKDNNIPNDDMSRYLQTVWDTKDLNTLQCTGDDVNEIIQTIKSDNINEEINKCVGMETGEINES